MKSPPSGIKSIGFHGITLAAALLLAGTATAFADLQLNASAEPREARVGDPIKFAVNAVASADIKVQPFPVEKTLGAFEVLDFKASPPFVDGQTTRQQFLFTLTTFEVGVTTIPALTFKYQTSDGQSQEQKTLEIHILIKSVLSKDSKDIRDIKEFIGGGWNIWIILGVILFIAAGVGIYFWRRQIKNWPEAPKTPPRPADEIALEELERLSLILNEPGKVFYSRLSDCLRRYLENRFSLPAMDRTTSEISNDIKKLPVTSEARLEIRDALETGDLAKFAKLEPTNNERLRDIQRVREFVISTRPVVEKPAESAQTKP